jgi:hypothetical protein
MNGRLFTDIEITGELAQHVASGYSGIDGIFVQKDSEFFLYNGGVLTEVGALPDGYYYVVNGNDQSYGTYSIPGFSGVFSRKEFNVYSTNESNFSFVLDSVMGNNKNIDHPETGIDPYVYAAPLCLISFSTSANSPFSFGGQDRTDVTARVLTVAKDRWQMDGLMSIFRDSNNLKVPLIPSSGSPLDFYGDLKYDYNYHTLYDQYCNDGTALFIDKVVTSKISEKKNGNSTFFVSSLEFQLQSFRYPRINP